MGFLPFKLTATLRLLPHWIVGLHGVGDYITVNNIMQYRDNVKITFHKKYLTDVFYQHEAQLPSQTHTGHICDANIFLP